MLTSRSALPHPGHYLTFIEPASRELTTLGCLVSKRNSMSTSRTASCAPITRLALRAAIPGAALPHPPQTCTGPGHGSRTTGVTCRIRSLPVVRTQGAAIHGCSQEL